MNHLSQIWRATVASLACALLVFTPLDSNAKKGTNNGNGNGSSGSTTTTTTSATGFDGSGFLVLGAPGVGLEFKIIEKTPFAHVANIGRYYKYVFTGIEVQCDADGVAGAYSYSGYMWDRAQKSNNGHGNNCDGVDSSNPGQGGGGPNGQPDPSGEIDDECNVHGDHDGDGILNHSDTDYTGGHFVFGWWSMGARVNTETLGNLTFTSAKLNELSPMKRMLLTTPKIFREQNITLEWNGTGNTNDPDGHFYILGSAIKEPPVPRGELQINQTHYEDGATPQYGWNIERE